MGNTLDNLMGKVADVADAAVKTTGAAVAKGKEKAQEAALQAKLAKRQRQLGALVYSLQKSGEENTAMVQWYVEEMDDIHRQLQAVKTPQENLHQVVQRPAAEEKEDAMFRGDDGDELSE